jgi:SAM-dependent methyltransferase
MSYSCFAGVYDMLTENVEYSKRADYFCSLLAENGINGGLLLDLACGTGSLSFEFEKRGYSVIGVDLSPEMLSIAQNKKYDGNSDVLFLQQDMRALDLYGSVDCCVCALDSLNHLTGEKDLFKAFKSVSEYTENGGIFIFDMNTEYKHKNILADNCFVYDCGDVFCVWQNSLQSDGSTVDITLDFFEEDEDGMYERHTENFSEKAYPDKTVKELLEKADFTLVGEYKELTAETPDETTQRIVYIARRNPRK